MGAAPKQPPSAARVAQSFVNVYYRVAEKLPQRIVELYGSDSEIHHGDGLSAIGPAIAHVATKLPLAGAETTVNKVAAQQTGASAYLVVVHGTFSKDSLSVTFTQTFVLEKQRDSHDVHFYCRNDIFTILPDTPQPSQNVSSEPEPVVAATLTDSASTSTPVEPSKPTSPPPVLSESPHAPQLVPDVASESLQPPNGMVPHNESDTHTQASSESAAAASNEAASPPSAVSLAADGGASADLANGDSKEPASVARSVPPARKTWASIVSSKDEVDGSTTVAAVPEEKAVAVVTPVVTPVVAPELAKQIAEVVPSETESKNAAQSTQRQENVQNGHRSSHQHGGHPYRGHARVFGPSAVVQLSNLGEEFLQDVRGLTNCFREEFSTYGHKLRHVEVKMAKGIAFIEYETMDGVRAAVSEWANGAKDVGPFKGIALNVSEKRPAYGGRRPGSMRGGRGGARGARRHRANLAPIS